MDDERDGNGSNGRQPGKRPLPWEDWPHATGDDAATDGGALGPFGRGDERLAEDEDEDGEASQPGWVSAGGVLEWTEQEEAVDPATEAASPLAEDDLTMPEGAPPGPRLRAVHAWLARRRLHEQDALGELLLAQREQRTEVEREEPAPRRRRHGEPEVSPLDLALAEHQAAADEYDALLAALDNQVAHAGPQRALVEFYLELGEHLAALANEPDADDTGGPAANPAKARWLGRAQAALATRTRVEQMTVPAQED